MTNTTTQSGPRCPHSNLPASECVGCLDEAFRAKRPPNATRPTDAELARLLRKAAELCDGFARKGHPRSAKFYDDDSARFAIAADALDAAPARLTPEQWQGAVERAADALYSYEGLEGLVSAGDPSDFVPLATDAMYAAFPHLAPNPECGCFYCDRPTSDGNVVCAACRAERDDRDDY